MSSIKEKPELYRSDIMELYDRSLKCLADLSAIAADRNFSITIDISTSGKITFKTYEFTKDKLYMKEQEISADCITYRESEYKN